MLKVSSFVRCPGQHLQERRLEVGASYTSYDNRRYISLKYQKSQNVPPLVGLHQTVRQGRRTVAASSSSSSSLQSSNNEASGGFVLWLLQVIQVGMPVPHLLPCLHILSPSKGHVVLSSDRFITTCYQAGAVSPYQPSGSPALRGICRRQGFVRDQEGEHHGEHQFCA